MILNDSEKELLSYIDNASNYNDEIKKLNNRIDDITEENKIIIFVPINRQIGIMDRNKFIDVYNYMEKKHFIIKGGLKCIGL